MRSSSPGATDRLESVSTLLLALMRRGRCDGLAPLGPSAGCKSRCAVENEVAAEPSLADKATPADPPATPSRFALCLLLPALTSDEALCSLTVRDGRGAALAREERRPPGGPCRPPSSPLPLNVPPAMSPSDAGEGGGCGVPVGGVDAELDVVGAVA